MPNVTIPNQSPIVAVLMAKPVFREIFVGWQRMPPQTRELVLTARGEVHQAVSQSVS